MEFIGKWSVTSDFIEQEKKCDDDDEVMIPVIQDHPIFQAICSNDSKDSSASEPSLLQEEKHLIITARSENNEECLIMAVFQGERILACQEYPLTLFSAEESSTGKIIHIIQNLKEPYRKLSILHLSARSTNCACEHLIVERHDVLRIVLSASSTDGSLHYVSKCLRRVADYIVENNKKFETDMGTVGWDMLKYWPSNVIELCEVKIIRVKGLLQDSSQGQSEHREEVLWSLDQSIEDVKKNVYNSTLYNDPANKLYFTIQIASGKVIWRVSRSHQEVFALMQFMKEQAQASGSTETFFQKGPPALSWKSYVEFHRMVLAFENLLRLFFQQAAYLNQNHVNALCSFFQIPAHLDGNQVRLVETMIEEDSLLCEGGEEAKRPFVSYRLDFLNLDKLRLPPEEIKEIPSRPSGASVLPPTSPTNSLSGQNGSKPGPSIYQSNQFAPNASSLLKPGSRRSFRLEKPQMLTQIDSDNDNNSIAGSVATVGNGVAAESADNAGSGIAELAADFDDVSIASQASRPLSVSLSSPSNGAPGLPPRPIPSFRSASSATNKVISSYDQEDDNMSDITDIYNKSATGLKVMPVDLVSNDTVKANIARGLLLGSLEKGITVIKHGRKGQPKKKVLKCDPEVSRLYWVSEKEAEDPLEDNKHIEINQIRSIRVGTDIDPATSEEALKQAAANGTISERKLLKTVQQKEKLGPKTSPKNKGLFSSFFSTKEEGILYGTAALRRTCKPEHMALCISFILPDRTFDIQCLNQKDFNLLLINLREITKLTIADSPLSSVDVEKESPNQPPMNRENANTNPLKSSMKSRSNVANKSVRFSGDNFEEAAVNLSNTLVETHSQETISSSDDKPSIRSSGSADTASPSKIIFHMDSDGDLGRLLDRDPTDTMKPKQLTVLPPGRTSATVSSAVDGNGAGRVSPIRMSSTEALQIGMILSEQEKAHKTNMYESLTTEDHPTVQHYVKKGYTVEEAILKVFERKFGEIHNEDDESVGTASQGGPSLGRKSSFFPDLADEAQAGADTPDSASLTHAHKLQLRLKSSEALQVGLLLSQQEEEYGTNMYDSLRPEDEEVIRRLTTDDHLTTYEAVLKIFEDRFVNSDHPPTPPPPYPSEEEQSAEQSLHRVGSSFFPRTDTVLPSTLPRSPNGSSRRLLSSEAMELAMLLSDQEARFGTNMYDSLTSEDESELQILMQEGHSMEKAVEMIFNRKFCPNSSYAANYMPARIVQPPAPATAYNAPPPPPPAVAVAAPQYGGGYPGGQYDAQYAQGYPSPPAYPQQAYPPQGYPPQGYQPQAYPPQGYPPQGYPPQGYASQGYPQTGYPAGYPSSYAAGGGYGYPQQAGPYPAAPYGMQPVSPYYAAQGQGFPGYYAPNQAFSPQPSPMGQMYQSFRQQGPPNSGAPTIQHTNSEDFYGDIVPTELSALVTSPIRAESFHRVTGTSGSPNRPNGKSVSDSAPATAAPLSASSPNREQPKKIVRKISLFSRKNSQQNNGSDSTFGAGNSKLKYKEADVRSIMQMGFSKDQAVWALIQNDNNVVNAILSLTG
eukprot:gene3720-4069_t